MSKRSLCTRLLSAFIVCSAILVAPAFVSSPATANGCITPAAGTANNPFLIQSLGNLQCLNNNDSYYWHHGYHFKQTVDIDLTGQGVWSHGIGDDTFTFNGAYDGNGHTITGLQVAGASSVGLFGHTSAATLSGITLVDDSLAGSTMVGSLVGLADDTTTISNSHASGQVRSGGNSAGGLVGQAGRGTLVFHSSADVDVTLGFAAFAGGLIGYTASTAEPVTISYSSASGDGFAFGGVGGLVGGGFAPLHIDHSYASGQSHAGMAAGGLVGSLVGDDTFDILIDQSFATGMAVNNFGGSGGLVGEMDDPGALGTGINAITDSYSLGAATATYKAGGITGSVAATHTPGWYIMNTYAAGMLTGADDSTGGIVGVMATPGAGVVSDSFWNPTDSGANGSSAYGTQSTASAMRGSSLYSAAGWDIADTVTAGAVWGSCASINGGLPFLQWYAVQEGLSCGDAPPPAPIPAGPPTDVLATVGSASATVSWQAPSISGSYPVSTYQAIASPGGASCLTSDLTCTVNGLTNGTTYTFTVQALSGAGWGAMSAPSNAVTPKREDGPTIVITGTRGSGSQSRSIFIEGVTTGLTGSAVIPMVKLAGDTTYTAATPQRVDADGHVTWSRRTSKKAWVYLTGGGVRSNVVTIQAR